MEIVQEEAVPVTGPLPERFSASVAGRHMSCPASANLGLAIPHWVAPDRDPMAGAKGVGTRYHALFANIAVLPAKDIDAFGEAFKYVAEVRARRRFTVIAEKTMVAGWLQGRPKTTADLVFYTADEIHIFDLKTGKIEVEVVENEQLLFYAACYSHLAPKARGVTLHIVQPWAPNGSSSWFVDTNRIRQFIDDAVAAEKRILAGDVTFGPSDHCTFCPANPWSRGDKGRPLCPAMMHMLYPEFVDEQEMLGL